VRRSVVRSKLSEPELMILSLSRTFLLTGGQRDG
jgi:hypothetical protein